MNDDDTDPPRQPIRTITVEIFDGNDINIREGDRYTDRLTWDEAIGTIAELTHPAIGKARYRMETAAEHAARAARYATMRADRVVDATKLPFDGDVPF